MLPVLCKDTGRHSHSHRWLSTVCQALDWALQALVPTFPVEACSSVPSGLPQPREAVENPVPQGMKLGSDVRA